MRLIIRNFSTRNLPIVQLLRSRPEQKYSTFDTEVNKNLINRDVIKVHRAFFPLFLKSAVTDDHGEEFSDVMRRFKWVQYYHEFPEVYSSLTMMHAYKIFEQPDRLTLDNLKMVSMLAWAFETVVISLLMLDDIVDGQEIRAKLPCWYKIREIGLSGINDINLMRSAAFNVVKKYVGKHKSYSNILNYFCRAQLVMAHAQTIDVMTTDAFLKSRCVNLYNFDHYKIFCKYKAYECVIHIPFLAIMSFLGIEANEYHVVEETLTYFGNHMMILNDVYDCFGKYENYGRPCQDISEGKLSWVIATALQHANEKQRTLLERNYGKTEEECQNIVKEIYKEIDVISKYYEYKKDVLDKMHKNIEKMPDPRFSEFMKILINSRVNVDDDLTY